VAFGGGISITHRGVVEVEQALQAPTELTEHFPPFNLVVVQGDMNQSQVQVGTSNSSQGQHNAFAANRDLILTFTRTVRVHVDGLAETGDDRRAILADLETVEAQLESPRPNPGVMRAALSVLTTIVLSAAGSGLFEGLAALASRYAA
jgi:hypothetical protein